VRSLSSKALLGPGAVAGHAIVGGLVGLVATALIASALVTPNAYAGPTSPTLPVAVVAPAPAPPDNCLDGYWPLVAEGAPSGFDASYHGAYLWQDPNGGWALRVTHTATKDRAVFSGTLETSGRFVDVRPLRTGGADIIAVSPNGRTIIFRFVNYRWVDGLDFATHCSAGFTVSIDINGQGASPNLLHLGGAATAQTSNPFRVQRAHGHLPRGTTSTVASTTSTTGGASTSPGQVRTLARLKREANRKIDARTKSLQVMTQSVVQDLYLGTDGTSLVNELNAAITDLAQLRSTIQADTTFAQAEADYALGTRVYYLVMLVTKLVTSIDYMVNVSIPGLNNFLASVQPLVTASNQSQVQPLLLDIRTQLSAAANATEGLSAQLLSYTPAQYDANRSLLDPATTAVNNAKRALAQADQDATAIRRYVRQGDGPPLFRQRQHSYIVVGRP
jgi:hypothetical protein